MRTERDLLEADEAVSEDAEPSGDALGHRSPARRARFALGGAVLGSLLIAVGLVALLVSTGDGGEVAVSAGANVVVNSDANSINAHNSPSLAMSPADANVLAVAGRIDRPQYSASVHVSDDAGATWRDLAFTPPPGEERVFAPDVGFDSSGALFVLFSTLRGPGNVPSGLWLARSPDRSALEAPVRVAGPYSFQPRLAVDPRSGAVHATWVQATAAVEQVANGFGPPPNPIMMATSTDAGRSFGTPVRVSDEGRARVGAAAPAIGRDGEVYVLYQDFGNDVADFEGRPGPAPTDPFTLVLARSTDNGRTFATAGVVDRDVTPAGRFLVYVPQFPSLAVDPGDGTLYAGWADARNGDTDVFVRRSTDGGRRWGAPVRVNDDRERAGRSQYLPALAVAPGGRVHALYLDRGEDPDNVLTKASLATSVDRGETWESITLSDVLFDGRVGPGSEREAPDPGSRLAVVAAESRVYAVWADARSGTLDTDKQDLVFAPVAVEAS